MSFPLLSTKVYIPSPRQGIILRRKLIDQLHTGRESKVILVSAPAGYGKTTLLAEWIEQRSFQVAWVSLDKQDNDLVRFFSYFLGSLNAITKTIDESILTNLKDQNPASSTAFLSLLINQVSTSSKSIFLVLDDYHRITNPRIHQSISYLIENLPRNMHIIIATRSDPPLRLAKLRAQGELCEIRVDDLRFTIEETVQYLNERMKLGLSQTDIAILTKKTEGWIVGLQLAGISLQKHPDKHQFIHTFAGDDRYIADYLFDEAFTRQPDHIQSFLLDTSILDQFNAQLCDVLTGQDDSQTILLELERANLFLVPLDNQRNWYRYHHLFRDLLQKHIRYTTVDRTLELHLRASQWYAQGCFFDQAATHAIKAKDIHQLEHLIQENMLFLLETGESHLFENQLSSFYASFDEPNLWVCIARAWSSAFSGQIDPAEDALKEAEALASALSPEDDQIQLNKALGHIATILGYIASLQGDTIQEINFAKNALALLPKDDHATIAYAAMMLASAFARYGKNKQAETACLDAVQASETIPDSYIRIDALCMLSHTQYMLGKLQNSNDAVEKALKIASKKQTLGFRHLPVIGLAKIRKCGILYEMNELEQAEEILNQGLAIIEKCGDKESYFVGVSHSVVLAQIMGNTEQAFMIIKQGKAEAEGLAYWFSELDVIEAWLYAKNGKTENVEQWLKKHQALFSQPPTFQQEFIYRYLTEILIIQGDFTRAENIINSLLLVVERAESIDRLIRTLILKSKVQYKLGENEKAKLTLAQAIELAQPRGYKRTFIDGGEEIAQLLYQCVQQDIHKRYCSKLLEAFPTDKKAVYPKESDSSTEFLVESLSKRESEVLQLIAEGDTNQEIAEKLVISLYTVKSHARNIFGKLGVKNRTESIAKAQLLGLLPQN